MTLVNLCWPGCRLCAESVLCSSVQNLQYKSNNFKAAHFLGLTWCVCAYLFFSFFSEKETNSLFFHIFICCFSACGQIGVLSKMFFLKKIEKQTGINFRDNYEMPANQRCWRRGLLDVHLHRWQVIEMWLSDGDSDTTEEVLSKRHHCVRKSEILLLVHSSKELRKLLIILQGKPLNVSFGMWYDTEDSSICNNEHLALCPPFKRGQWCHTDVHGTLKIGVFSVAVAHWRFPVTCGVFKCATIIENSQDYCSLGTKILIAVLFRREALFAAPCDRVTSQPQVLEILFWNQIIKSHQ